RLLRGSLPGRRHPDVGQVRAEHPAGRLPHLLQADPPQGLQHAVTDDRRALQARAESILLLVTLTWGLTFPAIKLAVTDGSPALFMVSRFALVIPALWLIGRRRFFRNLAPTAGNGILLGSLLWASYFCQALGLAWTTATRSAFITGLSVLIVPFLD